MSKRAAIYARYSTAQQRASSIEDQVRRCTEIAKAAGYEVTSELIFADSAISGSGDCVARRVEYQSMLKAWDERAFDALVVDEISRLARDGLEIAIIADRVERSNIRLLTADGIDSTHPGWQLVVGITGALAVHAIRETRHRVVRGMRGQLERGYEIGPPAYGYELQRDYGQNGVPLGTNWVICAGEAEVVRGMFKQRVEGRSVARIARELNQRGVAPPRGGIGKNHGTAGYWRAGSVHRLLGNSIYRGIFVWNGSTTARDRARTEHRQLAPVEYARPHLALVDDYTWFACNQRGPGQYRAGRKHLLSGLLTCGDCGATLSVCASRPPQVYCASCYGAKRVSARTEWMGYVSATGVVRAIRFVLESLLAGAPLDEFRRRLAERIAGGASARLDALRDDVARLSRACQRLARAVRESDVDDDVLGREYRAARAELLAAEAAMRVAARGLTKAERATIKSQMQVEPLKVLEYVLSDASNLERVQSVLRRVFPKIVLAARPRRFESVLEMTLAPGVALAEASNTEVVEAGSITLRVRVRCGPARPTVWEIERI
jgi:site-specific DNA recombinase